MSKDLVQPQPSPDQPLCDHPVSEWMPIETAPRDGTQILLFGDWEGEIRGANNGAIGVGHWGGYHWDLSLDDRYAAWCEPTHWMPLPSPPTSGDRTESAPRSPVVETNQSIRLAVIEECAGAIRERRWSADPAAITGGSEVGFANERELAAFILGLEEAVNIVRGTVLK